LNLEEFLDLAAQANMPGMLSRVAAAGATSPRNFLNLEEFLELAAQANMRSTLSRVAAAGE
jgi:hypothetical protein